MKNDIQHISGAAGGYLVGNSHANGGIQAINKAVGKPLEMEGGEVVITKPAVDDNEKREFEGEMLTNRQILSKINVSGGGVSFAELGAELPTHIDFCGNQYKYGGETLTDYEIAHKISKCGCSHEKNSYADGGEVYSHKHSVNWGENITIKLIEPTSKGWKVEQTTEKTNKKRITKTTKTAFYSSQEIKELFDKVIFSDGGETEKRTTAIKTTSLKHYKELLAKGVKAELVTKQDLNKFESGGELETIINQKFAEGFGKVKYFEKSNSGGSWKYVNNPFMSVSERKQANVFTIELSQKERNEILEKRDNYNNNLPKEISILEYAKKLAKENNAKITHKSKSGSVYLQIENPNKNSAEKFQTIRISDHYILDRDSMNPKSRYDYEIVQKNFDENDSTDLTKLFEIKTFADGGELQTLDNLSIKNGINDVEYRLIKMVLPIFPDLKVEKIIELSDRIAAYDNEKRDSQHTAEAIQYLTQDFSNFDRNDDFNKKSVERLEAFGIIPKLEEANSNEIVTLYISPENNLSKQLKEYTGDYWNAYDFANVEEIPGNLSFMKPFYHKETGKKFVVADNSSQPKAEKRKPKYNVGDFVSYTTGDIETEKWVGVVKEVKDFDTEFAYRLDAYTTNVDSPMFNSEKTNETYEAVLKPSTKVTFNKAKAAYEWYKDLKNKSNNKKYDLNSSWSGGAVVVYDRNQTENRDYKTIAHVFSDGKIKYFEENLPKEVIDYVEKTEHPNNVKPTEIEEKSLSENDNKHTYMMLSRLKSDCEYFLGNGNRSENNLWADNVKDHINEMKRLWESLKIKPEWLSMDDILNYEKQMINSPNMIKDNYQISDYKNPYEVNRAIEALIDSKEDNFTPNEIEFIANYSGYGGLEKQGTFSDEELKGLLYEYFTPDAIVKKMWALAYKFGFGSVDKPHVFEPSVGTGNFFKYAPAGAELFGNEINNYSKRVCEILYPKAMITLQPFEKNFISKNNSVKNKIQDIHKYHLVIGNPPYGRAVSKFMSMGEGDYTKASNFTEYFITRGLDLLLPGGLLIFVVGAEQYNGGTLFLDSGISAVKKNIFDKAQLVDAYRLPTKIFERTGVASEILVFKKK